MTTVFLIFRSDPEAVRAQALTAGLIPLIIDAKEAGWWERIPSTSTDIYIESVENISQVIQYLETIKTSPRHYYSFPPPPPLRPERQIPSDLVPILLSYLLGGGTSSEDVNAWSREEPRALRLAAKEVMGTKTLPSLEEATYLFQIWGTELAEGKREAALIETVRRGHLPVVKYLVDIGADIHVGREEPLIEAARRGHLEIVKYLAEKGSDINVRREEVWLEDVPVEGQDYLARNERVRNLHLQSERALVAAAGGGHLEVVKYLVERGADIDVKEEAVPNEDNGVARYLRHLHLQSKRPLEAAAEKGHLEVIRYLVGKGADIHAREEAALAAAAGGGHLEAVKYLVERGADIHADREAALAESLYKNHLKVVEYLMERGADIHVRDLGWFLAHKRSRS